MFENIIFANERENVHKAAPQVEDSASAPDYVRDGHGNATREFDVAEATADRQLPMAEEQTDAAYRDAVATRLGNMHVIAVRPYSVKEVDVPGLTLASPDPFLRGDRESAYIGGMERGGGLNRTIGPDSDTPGKYTLDEPDGDLRGPADEGLGNATDPMDEPILGPANNFNAPRPGNVGGVPVRKRVRAGTFTAAIFGDHGDLADSFLGRG